jgi:hypothetical protein
MVAQYVRHGLPCSKPPEWTYTTVRKTSSMVVRPWAALRRPSERSRIMPFASAVRAISVVETRCSIWSGYAVVAQLLDGPLRYGAGYSVVFG